VATFLRTLADRLPGSLVRLGILCAFIVAIGMIRPRLTPERAGWVLLACGLVTLLALAAFLLSTWRVAHRLPMVAGSRRAFDAVRVLFRRTGLPLLALYTAPVSILEGGVPWWVFVVGAVSFLALLASEEGRRLMSWGRRVPRGDTVFDTAGGVRPFHSLNASNRERLNRETQYVQEVRLMKGSDPFIFMKGSDPFIK